MVWLLHLCLTWTHSPHLAKSPIKSCLTRGCPAPSFAFTKQCGFPLLVWIRNSTNKKRMCHLIIFLMFVRNTFPFFCISGKLWGCGVSKPSIPSLVGQIVRQQDLRCPFLVISGGNECYHNPLSNSHSLSLFAVNHLKSPSAAWCRSFIRAL